MSGLSSAELLADAEPEDGDRARERAAHRFQDDPAEARRRKTDPFAEQHREYIHQDLVDEASSQALAGHVRAEDLQVFAARGAARSVHRFPDVTGEEPVRRVRRLWRPVAQDEDRSGPASAIFLA